ncbi:MULTISPECIES: hypothetical protein [Polaromonas]|uniref:Uncharacterized protein n=1 Tax=Polaromonas aquatica TaxID=332657 RepID=A0ABW1U274_9BURK
MTFIKYLLILSTTLATLACSSMGGSSMGSDSTVTEATAKQLSGDVPLPPGTVIKQQDTLVMGTGNTWTGRLNLAISGEPQAVFTYFRDGMPGAGWTLTSSSFSKLSLLTFTKGERVANVQMQSTNFGGNEVLVTVAPAAKPVTSRP